MAPRSSSKKPGRPLDQARLDELALAYVGRFATTRAKLGRYLDRKLRERGWEGAGEPDLPRLIERFARLGYVDDAAFAVARANALVQRGFGPRRVKLALRQAGVDEEDSLPAVESSSEQALGAALRYAQRRRLGPFADAGPAARDPQRALAAMMRAGHAFELARRIVAMKPKRGADVPNLVIELSNNDG